MVVIGLDSPFMAKKRKGEDTEQFNVQLRKSLVKRLREFCNAHEMHPTYTQVADAALVRYLDAEEPKLVSKPKPGRP